MKKMEKSGMTKQKHYVNILVCCGIIFLACLLFLTPLDHKIQDAFLRTSPSVIQNRDFVLVVVDDKSIEDVGYFPFTRDVYADLVFLMNEAGVNQIVFDLAFNDKNPYENSDVIFANALKMFKNITIPITFYDEDTKIIPPYKAFADVVESKGYVNSKADADGYTRRIPLIKEINGQTYNQLMFSALLKFLENPDVENQKNKILLKNAVYRGQPLDIEIPKGEDGAVILKYPKISYEDYNLVSFAYLYQFKEMEQLLYEEIEYLQEYGFFDYFAENPNLTKLIKNIRKIKKDLLENSESDYSFSEYCDLRKTLLENLNSYLSENYVEKLIDLYDDDEITDFINESLNELKYLYEVYTQTFQSLQEKIQDTVCVIGTAATSTGDYSNIAYENHIPSFIIHQTLGNMIINQDFTDDCAWYISGVIALIFCLLYLFVHSKIKTIKFQFIPALAFLVFLLGLEYSFFALTGIYLGLIVPLVSFIAFYIYLMVTDIIRVKKEKSFVVNAFGYYLSKSLVNEILKDPSKLKLGGEKRNVTAVFTDIRKFSTISEEINDPEKLVHLLNKYLSRMSDIILKRNGTIDKFEGDAIICFFGAPVEYEDHAKAACAAALEMKAAEKELNKEIIALNESPFPLFTRIGINTGDMVVGNMGTDSMMNYTMMGHNVNLAARLEGVNKVFNTGGILISQYTKEQIGDSFITRKLDRVRVVGIDTPIRLYELLSKEDDETLKAYILDWEKALNLFEQRQYKESLVQFISLKGRIKEDGVLEYYTNRCIDYVQNPPEASWDGVLNLTSK